MRQSPRPARVDLLCLGLLAVLSIGFLWRCTLGGRVMLPADLLLIMEPWKHHSYQFPEFRRVGNPILDAVQQFYPWRKFAGENLRAGHIPLWNPHELCGNPFMGNNQSALAYPETWLHALMPPERALGWATALYFLLSGGLMYWFLRLLDLRRAACLLGAIAFMFNGFVVGWLCFPSFRSVPGWLPGMLGGYELVMQGRRARGLAIAGLCTGMQFLAGNLHISLYVLMVFSAYALARGLGLIGGGEHEEHGERLTERRALRRGVLAAVGVLILGGMLACGQLLPTLELVGMSSRAAGGSYGELLYNALPLPVLLTALMPDVLGNPVDYNDWGATLGKVYRAYTERALYVGVLPVLLLPAAFIGRRRQAWFWLAVIAVGGLLALGTHLNALLYYLVPAFKSLTGIGRAVVMVSTGLAVGGALGLHCLLELAASHRDRVLRYLSVAVPALGAIGLAGGLWAWLYTGQFEDQIPGVGAYTLLQLLRFGILLAVGGAGLWLLTRRQAVGVAIVLACLVADMYLFVDKFSPAERPEYLQVHSAAVERMRSAPEGGRMLSLGKDPIHRMAPNTPMIVGLQDIQGSDSLEVGRYRRLLRALCHEDADFPQPDPSLPAIDLLGVRYVHSSRPLEGIEKLAPVSAAEGYLYENLQALPRAFSPERWEPGGEGDLQRVAAVDFDPRKLALVEGGPAGRGAAAEVHVTQRNGDSLELSGSFAPGQVIVVANTFYPGWRAYQGKAQLPLLRANHALSALRTESADTPIRVVYAPSCFAVGGFLGLLALGVIAGLLCHSLCGEGRAGAVGQTGGRG